MDPLYNIGIRAYRGLVRIASVRNVKARQMLKGQSRTFKLLREKLAEPAERTIWIHAASLGEFEQGRPLIEKIRCELPEVRIVLTFFSPSGYNVRKDYDKVDVVCYLPFDLPGNVKRFLNLVKPDVAIFIKYEFWGNYLRELHRRGIPTYSVSAIFRPSQMFFKPWGKMFREMLDAFTMLFVQNEESRRLLANVGITQVEIVGDTRFDRVADIRERAKHFPIVEAFVKNKKFVLVMGSSWQPDEDIVLPYFNDHREVALIVAPHEFDGARLAALKGRMTRRAEFYSEAVAEKMGGCDCLIIDSFGILSSLYAYGTAAYVGGGFGAGIHNVNEAAVWGIPVIFGPNYGKFREARELIACRGGFSIADAEQFGQLMDSMLADPQRAGEAGDKAGEYINSNLGATEKVFNAIFRNKEI